MFKFLNRYWAKPAVVSVLVECCLLFFSVSMGYRLRFMRSPRDLPFSEQEFFLRAGAFTLVFILTAYLNGLYDFSEHLGLRRTQIRLLRSLSMAVGLLVGVYYFVPYLFMGRGILFISLILALLLLTSWRLALSWILHRRWFNERVLIVGADEPSRELAREVITRSHLGYKVVGFVADDPEIQGASLVNPRVIGTTAEVSRLATEHQVARVVVALRDRRGRLSMEELLKCKTLGIVVEAGSDFYERLTGKVSLEGLRIRSWLVFSKGYLVSRSTLLMKRMLDILVSAVGIVLALPVILVTVVAIKLESRGPVLYRQERLGKDGKPFTILKFRSMCMGAEDGNGATWATKADPRVTKIGQLIRRNRIDEIPQLWNVLIGDMSFVGPRPERKEFVDQLDQLSSLYQQRLVVRPGITGWAQINAPYAFTLEQSLEKLEYDLYYLKNISIFLDLSIIASTLRIVLIGRGAN